MYHYGEKKKKSKKKENKEEKKENKEEKTEEVSLMRVTWRKWEEPPLSERKKLPRSYFLYPSELKFPYKEWKGALKGAINCNALRSAITLAGMHGYPRIKAKAQRLYHTYCSVKRRSVRRRRKR